MNPFRPGGLVDPEYFVGREKEIEAFKQSLELSGVGNPQHLAIMGERGIGKSSLLRKFESISDLSKYLIVRRDLDASLESLGDITQFILSIIKSAGISHFRTRTRVKEKIVTFFRDYSWQVSFLGIGGGAELKRKVVLQDFFYNELEKIYDNIKEDISSICIMLDEAEHLENIDGSWSFIRSVFSRLTENGINYLIIVSGKLGLFSNIKEIFSPMERFFYPWVLKPLTKKEVEDALIKPFHKYGKNLSQEVIDVIYEKSQGFPFIVQVFGFNIFNSDNELITKKILDEQISDIMNRLDVQVFKTRYESTGPQELIILKVISEDPLKKHTAKELNKITKIKSNRVTNILTSLVKKNCLEKTGYGEYMIFHPLFAEYVKRRTS